tara:strand:- start:2728 stop:3159 length:432 start_codon:yes stop_codon:yes gene_type:complete
LSDGCGGCQYCDFPYEAQLPVRTEKGYEKRTFKDIDDIWAVIDLIVQETITFNKEQGKDFDITKSISAQLPFFACLNKIRDEKYLKLLNKYVYCTETNTPAYSGSYGEQPARWVQYFFIIKNALAKREQKMHDKARREAKTDG